MKTPSPRYRVVKELMDEGSGCCPPTYSYTIREVFYLEDGTPHLVAEETIPFGTTRSELQEDLLRMIGALTHPTLDLDGCIVVERDSVPRREEEG